MKDIITFRKFLKNNIYDKNRFNINEMYKLYSTLSIFNEKDLKGSIDDFLSVILSSFDCINFTSHRDCMEFESDFSEFLAQLHLQILEPEKYQPSYFTKVVSALAPSKQDTKLLEVGAGEIPFSSIMFAKDFKDVTTMDKLILSNQCLSRFNVKGKDEYFKDDTNIENYDFIVGQRPCSAIESVVKNAGAENKPYLLELCYCDLGKIATREGVYRGWEEILPEYDSNVKFYHNFAFNLDATPAQVGKLLEEHCPPQALIHTEEADFLLRTLFENHEFFEENFGFEPCGLF